MRRFAGVTIAVVAMLAVVALAFAQTETKAAEKVRLKRIMKVGNIRTYKLEATMNAEDGADNPITFAAVTEDKLVKVTPEGNGCYESKTLSTHISMGGNEMDVPVEGMPVDKSVVTPQDVILSLESTEQMQDFQRRIIQASTPYFPDKDLEIGDTWQHEYKPDKAKGWRGGNSTDTLVAIETVGGIKCAKVQHKYTEKPFADDTGSIVLTGTEWIDVSTGEVVKATGDGKGIPSPMPGASGTTKMTMKMTYLPAK